MPWKRVDLLLPRSCRILQLLRAIDVDGDQFHLTLRQILAQVGEQAVTQDGVHIHQTKDGDLPNLRVWMRERLEKRRRRYGELLEE